MRKLFAVVLLVLATAAFAGTSTLFTKYESVRQALLSDSLKDVKSTAAALAADARTAKNAEVAKLADAVAKSADLAKARAAFAPLSDELIKQRASAGDKKPAVYHCPMVNKSWLQAKGKVGNPYDSAMKECGVLRAE